jgi:hypothetical protein
MKLGDTEEEVFAQIGLHLLLVQDLEHLLKFALRVALRDKRDATIESMTEEDRRTMGQFIRDLRKGAAIHSDLDALLKQVLEDRNQFAHRLRHQPWFDTSTTAGRDRIWDWFAQAEPRLFEATMILTAFALDYGKRIGYPDDFSSLPWTDGFYDEVTKKYMPRVRKLISKKG